MFKKTPKPQAPSSGALSFPFVALDSGGARQIADGVVWSRLAVPGRIDHVNVYFLRDEGGWTLVDTGVGDEGVEEQLAFVIERELKGAPIVRVIATHMHPAQIGQAGLLCQRFGAPLWMSRLEYLSARVIAADHPPAPQPAIDFLLAAGWRDGWLKAYRERYGAFGRSVRALPPSFTRIEDRDDVLIGGRVWRVITGEGHSPEHVCLWQPELKLFISGDQVLPETESVVAVWPTEPGSDPLNDWLTSCWRVMAAIPDDVLVLPSRDLPFRGLHARLDEIIGAAQGQLERLKAGLDKPRRVVDLLRAIHLREPGDRERLTVTGETLAHLNYLKRKGRVAYAVDGDGVAWFELDPTAEEEEDELEAL